MLDTTTKKRIDDCRDILVGKLPDPKAQIEQITIALIYKFMDDMDKEAVELGGKSKFFSGKYKKYNWDALFNAKVTAKQMLDLYSEAIESMEKNPNIPQLFRDIFKNAYLPYRDPETLKMFLKTIAAFQYTHSEKLGDAFEYLLSVMGSQGDAGQFRTPRHIIDFIVKAVDPGKKDTILDPACGTAGFLISAFKHILAKANGTSEFHSQRHPELVYSERSRSVSGSPKKTDKGLTPDERKKLIQNFIGYDISPDMVRLSLVNLYLHGFTDPHIHEYDTLSSEERWDETFDVILANPPFMSPKGGIRPHKKFSISSNRSEVLFVDYIAEHLNNKGRAGVIVPEGVIFQSGTAYKDLRKMLVEKYLYAVVSLPAGVFNPYSGVKTSILLMDKELAKKSDEILFVKIENDGFNLGAQRTIIKGSQLDEAIEILNSFKQQQLQRHTEPPSRHAEQVYTERSRSVSASPAPAVLPNPQAPRHRHAELVSASPVPSTLAHTVPKTKIAEKGDYNLSGERYKETILGKTEFELFFLQDLFEIKRGGSPRPIEDYITEEKDGINWIKIGDVEPGAKYITSTKQKIKPEGLKKSRLVEPGDFILSNSMSFGRPYIVNITGAIHDGWLVFKRKESNINKDYIFNILSSQYVKDQFFQAATGGVVKNLNIDLVKRVKIPLPPLAIQEEIVAEIEGYQKIIDGAKMVVENYKPKIVLDPDWEMVELGEIAKPQYGFTETAKDEGDVRFIRITDIGIDGKLIKIDAKYIKLTKEAEKCIVEKNDVLIARTGATYGKTMIFEEDYPAVFASFLIRLNFNTKKIFPKFYWVFSQSEDYIKQASSLMTGGGQPQFNGNALVKIKLSLPPIQTQRQIVAQIEKEQELVNANKNLV
ncbi:MAG: N-6 DNA methylase, partial [Bacteroidia bacterium]